MSDIITTDQMFTAEEQIRLDALLDTLVPASDDGSKPSATEVGFVQYLAEQDPEFVTEMKAALATLDISSELDLASRVELVTTFSNENPDSFRDMLSRVYDCYYQNDAVRREIGVVTGAPFPQGNEIVSGDLSLLDPVVEEEARHGYRKVK